jgi:hypothetical protein
VKIILLMAMLGTISPTNTLVRVRTDGAKMASPGYLTIISVFALVSLFGTAKIPFSKNDSLE